MGPNCWLKMGPAAVAAALACTGPAGAQTYTFSTVLTGAAETTPVPSSAGGTALVTFDAQADSVSVAEFFFGLTAPATASHIHCCTTLPLTGSAPVFLGFGGFPSAASGSYFDTFAIAASTFSSLLEGSLSGKAYVNVHDAAYPGGEIEGFLQLVGYAPVPEPADYALMLCGLAALAGIVRRRRND